MLKIDSTQIAAPNLHYNEKVSQLATMLTASDSIMLSPDSDKMKNTKSKAKIFYKREKKISDFGSQVKGSL